MKVLIAVLVVLLCCPAFASIEGSKAETKLGSEIKGLRDSSERFVGRLLDYRDDITDFATSGHIETSDKEKLAEMKSTVNSAMDYLNVIVNYVDANWPNL